MDFELSTKEYGNLHCIFKPVDDPAACIIMVHGLGDHIGRYKDLAGFFNKQGYSFIGADMPGHGKSPGKRGHIKEFNHFNDIISAMAGYIQKRNRDLKLILYGHSLGGAIALNYLVDHHNMAAGIITSPWLKLSFEPPRHKQILAAVAGKLVPGMLQPSGLNPADISSDETVVENYRNDPLVHPYISVALYLYANKNARRLLRCRDELKTPVLIMHSANDRITSAEGSKSFSANNRMAEVKIWDEGLHELHNEVFKASVLEYIINWINSKNGFQNKS